MFRKSTPAASISIVLILILAVAGVAYTQWTGSILVSGTVGTSGLDVGWGPGAPFCAGATTITPVDPSTVEISFTGAVQGDTDTCSLQFTNFGSIDVSVPSIVVDTGGVPATEFEVSYVNGTPPFDLLAGNSQSIDVTYLVGPDAQQFTDYAFTVTVNFEQIP